MRPETIPIEKIRVSGLNIRSGEGFGDEEDEELVSNIEALGILQPIIVRPVGEFYEVDVGRRRFLSAKKLGLTEVPCIVREASAEESMDASLSENIFRKNIDPVTLGRWVKLRLERGDISLSEYARRIGKPKSTLSEWVRMNDLVEELQREVKRGAVPFTYALKVARMDLTPEEERSLAAEAEAGGSEAFKKAVDRIAAGKEKRGAPRGLLVIRISWGLESPDYDGLVRLAEGRGMELGEYCRKILVDHVQSTSR